MLFRLFLLGSLLLFHISSACAIVSIGQSIAENDEEGMSSALHLSVDGAEGNSQKSSAQVDLHSRWKHAEHTELFWLEYDYGSSNGITNSDRTFLHLRHRTNIAERWDIELFGQTGRNAFTRLSNRSLVGGGMRYTLAKAPKEHVLFAGMGAMYEMERLNPKAGTTDRDSRLWRGNLFLVYMQKINDRLLLSSTTYCQPALSEPADYRFLEQASLSSALTGSLNLKISLDYSFDSRPPQTVHREDLRYRTGIELNF